MNEYKQEIAELLEKLNDEQLKYVHYLLTVFANENSKQ